MSAMHQSTFRLTAALAATFHHEPSFSASLHCNHIIGQSAGFLG